MKQQMKLSKSPDIVLSFDDFPFVVQDIPDVKGDGAADATSTPKKRGTKVPVASVSIHSTKLPRPVMVHSNFVSAWVPCFQI